MVIRAGAVNRGPAAAGDNRRAILAAARRVMAERGYRVPLSTIVREAGVSQGVLYRHFPTRLDLALAVFEDNFTELAAVAADPGPDAFPRLWARLVELTVESSAFVEMVLDARQELPGYRGNARLLELVEATLPRAQEAGSVAAGLTPADVLLAWRMVFGVVVTAADPGDIAPAVARVRALLPLP
ncbi:TetR/AcrR family transcriptional regulator [Modestobacter marinus]|uniref:AcrR family transcriptional regulator n=1 Tax=Modestobacter marinus TaxID=477641 RepID=A0A846M248_9ACTN|nr:TetR/AcrR family transcriptional regulator [Modestobacter marinus]NIH68600.1 AcrR family transcriptional regulator [Modestobacter marinus]GGL58512.1 TetR family transcriptional regulator [Modestobacter marinus]